MARKRKRKKGIRLKRLILLALIIYISSIFIKQKKMMNKMVARKINLENEIEALEKDIDELNNDIENSDSLDFIERVARDELGMVKPREILYIDKEKYKDSIFNLFRR